MGDARGGAKRADSQTRVMGVWLWGVGCGALNIRAWAWVPTENT